MNSHSVRKIQELKRDLSPSEYGDECPVCGEPFAVESSGILFHDVDASHDVVTWVRMCQGDLPDHYDTDLMQEDGFDPDTATMAYVHTDEHIDVIGGSD